MQIFKCSVAGSVVFCGAMLLGPAFAAETSVKIGVLTCKIESGWRYAVTRANDLHCLFVRSDRPAVAFLASVSAHGINLGYVEGSQQIWNVVASDGASIRDLEGHYAPPAGNGADGASPLVGGLGNRVMLLPSAQGQAPGADAVDWLDLKQVL